MPESASEAARPVLTTHPVGIAAGLAPNALVVATEVRYPDGEVTRCPAAPLLAGCPRHGHQPARTAPVTMDPVAGDAMLALASWPHGDGRAVGLGVAARTGATAHQALAQWLPLVRRRQVLLAGPRSFCAGVERAVEVVERVLAQHGAPVYVRKQIVHNAHVVGELESRGAVFVEKLEDVPEGATVVFSAHGVAPAVRAHATRRGLRVVDATCPLVTKVHNEARRFAARGDTVVVIGHAGHEETDGTLGQIPDRIVLVETAADVDRLAVTDPERVSYLTQTTLAADETAETVAALRARFPALRGPRSDDICYATTNRQNALRAIASKVAVVLVVGSANSSNSQRLVEVARRQGTAAYLIDGPLDIHPEWLTGATAVGLTAGASTPPTLVSQVVDALGGLGPVSVTEHTLTQETMRFTLPAQARL